MEFANSLYDYTKRGANDTVAEQYVTARLTQDALASTEVRPPIKNIGMKPPRFGYRTTTPDIIDVLNVDDYIITPWNDFSGRVSGYQGTSYPSLSPL